ncbi:pupal cuticule protein [Danaus plexippus plexippus]|uniref:Pupal cuticule protein n=1 Tax=Danaus plexippus plexippus TaxID=278856 RepID=A0A212EX86_DANPL|nr:pupal cuticule protein [Danaus plexippus plexippus]
MRELSVAFETSDTMRVLVLSALLACVSAAPSHLVPIGLAALPVAALPVAVPTVPSGDLQAALIDAQVKINDQAQELVDQARARAELVVENQNEGVPEANDLVKEKSEEAFWAAEEKKWQALNEAQVAAAKLDASVSSNIAAYKDAQVFPYAAIGSPMIAPVVPNAAGASAVSSGEEKADVKSADASEVKSAEGEVKSEAISEIKSEDKESVEVGAADVKSADMMKADGVMAAEMMKEDAIAELKKLDLSLQALKTVYPSPVAVAPSIISSPIAYSAYKGFPVAAVAYPGQFYAPTGSLFIKHAW